MFCPKCRTEYSEGIYVCADCGISLVPELLPEPPPESPEYSEFEEILFTFNAGDIAVIKSLLDSEGIVYYFGGNFSVMCIHWLNRQGSWFVQTKLKKRGRF